MPICYINPDGSHVRGCDQHRGEHPYDWCRDRRAERLQKIADLERELAQLREVSQREGDGAWG